MATVLIFDNSAVTCHTVSKQLNTYGFDTVQARSIGDARVALASKPVDLVILDLAAPDAGGMTLLRELRQTRAAVGRPRQKIPVIILTSSARDSDRRDARAAGALAFLTKPVSTRELLFTVNSALTLHAPAQQGVLVGQTQVRQSQVQQSQVPQAPAPRQADRGALKPAPKLVERVELVHRGDARREWGPVAPAPSAG